LQVKSLKDKGVREREGDREGDPADTDTKKAGKINCGKKS